MSAQKGNRPLLRVGAMCLDHISSAAQPLIDDVRLIPKQPGVSLDP